MESVECGAACLGMILAHFGRWEPLEDLRIACGVSRDGARAGRIVAAARSFGLESGGRKLTLGEAFKQPTPYVAFWGFNHFVVVEGFRGRFAFINDPGSGPRRVALDEFSESFTGVALTFRPTKDFRKGGRRPSVLGSLLPRLARSRLGVSYLLVASLILIIPGLILPAAMKAFVDDILIRGFNTWILPLILAVVLAGLLNAALTYVQQRILLGLQVKLGLSIASEFFWHVLRVPVVYYSQRYVGDVASRTQSCHRLAGLLAGPLPLNLVHLFTAIFFAGVMMLYSPVLTAVVAGLTALNLLVLRLVRRRREDLNAVMQNQDAQLDGASMAGLQAIETLKATGTENEFFQTWAGYQTSVVNTNQSLGAVSTLLNAAPMLVGHLTTAAVLGVGALLIIQGHLTIGGLVAFQALMTHFTGPVQGLVDFAGQAQQIRADVNRLNVVLRYRRDPVLQADDLAAPEGGAPTESASGTLTGGVELRDISFGYDPASAPLIDGFSLTVTPGQRIALVGASGSGKSTLGRLVVGLYQPTAGVVLYDGRPVTEIPRSVFAASVASVDQDIFLFTGSIMENLTLWDNTVPAHRVIEAARDACIHDVIAARPDGYDGEMAERGANFSGGQRQRLEIARALVRDPSLLILDEATSALDPTTERTIDDNLRRRGCTCLIIAHRLSTVRDCDEIIVLDRGHVVERGRHDDLMAAQGRYATLVAIQ
jgi:NHLM bacteriocin system ABC transporter peptidase/ATP-binding protein